MIAKEYIPRLENVGNFEIYEDPYWRIQIDAKDHSNIEWYDFRNWNRSTTCATGVWNGYNFVKLMPNSAAASADLTAAIEIPESGIYKIELISIRMPTSNSISLYDNNQIIESSKDCKHRWMHWHIHQFKKRYLAAGSHDFKLTMGRDTSVVGMFVYKVNEFVASNKLIRGVKSRNRLDVESFNFTMNNVNETNSVSIKAAMRDDIFIDYEDTFPMSKLKVDFMDPITIEMGKIANESKIMFGGYILSPEPNDDVLNISGGDRLLDLMRVPSLMNFKIGNPTITQEMNTFPYQSFPTIEDMVTYFCETSEYGIKTLKVSKEVGFELNFGNVDAYNSVVCTGGWSKQWDLDVGNPKPSLKIYQNGTAGASTCVLYNYAEGFDAATYNYLALDYFTINESMALQFNIKVEMYKAGQNPSNAITYTIHFNGAGSQSNVIYDLKPYYDGPFNRVVINLKEAFKKYGVSSQYIVSKIYLDGIAAEGVNCKVMWIDNVQAYKESSHSPTLLIQEAKKPFDILQDICVDNNMILYVEAGKERCDDVAVLITEESAISSEVVHERVNLMDLSNWNYNPKSNGYCNQAMVLFKFPNETVGSAFYQDIDSIKHYGKWQGLPANLTEIKDQISANNQAKTIVLQGLSNPISFSVQILGSTIVRPHEYILATDTRNRIQGLHQIKSLMMDYEKDSTPKFKTQIDLNRPSNRFKSKIESLKKEINVIKNKQLNSQYAEYGLNSLATSSPGAYNG